MFSYSEISFILSFMCDSMVKFSINFLGNLEGCTLFEELLIASSLQLLLGS